MNSTTSQQRRAFERSAQARTARGELRRDLQALDRGEGRARALEVLDAPEAELRGMSVLSLLTACRSTGGRRGRGILRRARVHEHTRLAEVRPDQLERLRAQMGGVR